MNAVSRMIGCDNAREFIPFRFWENVSHRAWADNDWIASDG